MIRIDFTDTGARIKPLHGIGQPPTRGNDCGMFHYLTEAGIPACTTSAATLAAAGLWISPICSPIRTLIPLIPPRTALALPTCWSRSL